MVEPILGASTIAIARLYVARATWAATLAVSLATPAGLTYHRCMSEEPEPESDGTVSPEAAVVVDAVRRVLAAIGRGDIRVEPESAGWAPDWTVPKGMVPVRLMARYSFQWCALSLKAVEDRAALANHLKARIAKLDFIDRQWDRPLPGRVPPKRA